MSRIQSHTTDLVPGAIVNRDFAVEMLVGRGAFSSVYRATQRSRRDRPVALKVLHRGIQNLIEQEAGRVRNPYMKEQLLCQRLKDPAVCRVVKVGTTEEGRYFVALEWAHGVTLDLYLRDHKAGVPFFLAASVADQLGRALTEMHGNRVIHRDIKPSNIMLQDISGGAAKVKILDFGIAKLGGEDDGVTREDEILVGTPAYMSPEQAAGRITDPRSDVFSLGAVIYEMLTGKRHIQIDKRTGDDYVRYLTSREAIPTLPLRSLRPEVPPETEAAVHRALSRDWNLRPRVIEELLTDVVTPLYALAPSSNDEGGVFRRAWEAVVRRIR